MSNHQTSNEKRCDLLQILVDLQYRHGHVSDAEIRRLVDEGYATAYKLIQENEKEFERLAQGLLEYETLTGEEIERVMRGDPPEADDDEGGAPEADDKPSLTAIPKTKPKSSPGLGEGGPEPEPSA